MFQRVLFHIMSTRLFGFVPNVNGFASTLNSLKQNCQTEASSSKNRSCFKRAVGLVGC